MDTPSAPAGKRLPMGRGGRRWTVVLALLVAAWVLPLLAYAVHAAWLLPPVVLLGTASLLRGGRTLLDRLILAIGLLIGLTCAFGLLWSVWPWGLRPVPVAGSALTVLVIAAALTGRRPTLPRPGWTDALSAGAALLMVGYLSVPFLRESGFTRRLGIVMSGEDNARHMAAFDAIGRLGGYLFVDQGPARAAIFSGMIYYPQGWHLTTALLDGFLRRPSAAPGGTVAFDHYVFWTLAGYALLLLVLIWATQWLAGRLHPLQRLAAIGVLAALALGTELSRLLMFGYPSEALGLSLALIVAALVIRPLAGIREQLVLLGALLVGLGFVYYLFVVPAGLLVLAWLIAERRRVLTRSGTLAVVAVLTAALAPITALCGVLLGGQTEALTAGGDPDPVYNTLLLLGALVTAGLLARGGWREPVWRRYAVTVLITVLFAVAVALANLAAGTTPGYYFIKTVHLPMALLIIGLATLARLLPTPRPAEGRRGWRVPVGVAALVTFAVFTGSGVIGWDGGFFHIYAGKRSTTWAGGWVHQIFQRQRQARATVEAYRAYPPIPGTVTLMIDQQSIDGYRESVFLSSLQGTSAQTEPGLYGMKFVEPKRLRQTLGRLPGRVRLVAASPAAERLARKVLATDPALPKRVTIVTLPP